jgi:hypothetical protein
VLSLEDIPDIRTVTGAYGQTFDHASLVEVCPGRLTKGMPIAMYVQCTDASAVQGWMKAKVSAVDWSNAAMKKLNQTKNWGRVIGNKDCQLHGLEVSDDTLKHLQPEGYGKSWWVFASNA